MGKWVDTCYYSDRDLRSGNAIHVSICAQGRMGQGGPDPQDRKTTFEPKIPLHDLRLNFRVFKLLEGPSLLATAAQRIGGPQGV